MRAEEGTMRDLAIQKAKELYERRKREGMDFSDGPCLAEEIVPDWCVDIAHHPRHVNRRQL